MESYWNKTSITLFYFYENVKELLNNVCMKENPFPQMDFFMWCNNLTMVSDEEGLDDKDELAFQIARHIECQWDLYWYEFYSHEKLMKLDLSKLELSHDWFE